MGASKPLCSIKTQWENFWNSRGKLPGCAIEQYTIWDKMKIGSGGWVKRRSGKLGV
jgi:hypothetical protein